MGMDANTNARSVLPRFPEPDTQPFWDATQRHELRYQTCDACGSVVFYPRSHCTKCTSLDLTWNTSLGLGTIYTFTVVRRNQDPAFVDLVPYVIAWVDLDEKFRMLTHIVDIDPDDPALQIGARVEVRWIDQGELSLPAFRIQAGA